MKVVRNQKGFSDFAIYGLLNTIDRLSVKMFWNIENVFR